MTCRRRRLVALALALVAPTILIASACSFPEVTFSADAGGGEAGAETGSETGPPIDTGIPDTVVQDVVGDAIVRDDATAVVDASVCSERPRCDCDKDGYLDKNCDAGEAGVGIDANAKPGDCDDLDPLRHPEAGFTQEVPISPNIGDWNCNGTVEALTDSGVVCSGSGALGQCNQTGYVTSPACGAKADTYKCVGSGAANLGNCEPSLVATGVTQACK
jgi:hypothetical protein